MRAAPQKLSAFDEFYVDIQITCDTFLNGEDIPVNCAELLSSSEKIGDEVNKQENITPLEDMIEFGEGLEDHMNAQLSSPLGEQETLKSYIDNSSRRKVKDQTLSKTQELQEACNFLEQGHWPQFNLDELKSWSNIVQKIYESKMGEKEQLKKQSFCFLKHYYETIGDYDRLMILLFDMPEGDNFCPELP